MGDKRKTASVEKVRAYWGPRLVEMGKFSSLADFEQSDGACFACGQQNYLDRAHILAHAEGGSGDADNLHLLCQACHHQSEMLKGDAYFIWFQRQTFIHAGLYWIGRDPTGKAQTAIANIMAALAT